MNSRLFLRNTFFNLTRRFPQLEGALKAAALLAAAGFGLIASFELRFDLAPADPEWRIFWRTLPILIAIRGMANWHWGLHRHWWRFVSVPDLGRLLWSTIAGSVAFAIVALVLPALGLPRSIILIEAAVTLLLVAGLMVASRQLHPGKASIGLGAGKRVLIVGAGDTGLHAARELFHHVKLKYQPIAFVDDDPRKQGGLFLGVPVLGTVADVPGLVKEYTIEEIVIAMPSAGRRRLREIMDLCQQTGLRVRILPATTDLIQGRVTVNRLREVRIEDLLGRPPVSFDLNTVEPLLKASVACITGAGGSIGSELCRQVASCSPDVLLMIDRNENNLHYLHLELAERFPTVTLQPIVADVTDFVRMEQLMATVRPRTIFHAAAFKHVPLMEGNPSEAVANNVGGTRNLAQLADAYGVERFVMISTDKAINPTSVMGATKRVAEILLQSLQRSSKTRFMTVRFGNVLGSEGSVVPIFNRQIARGGPVTVTHPNVVRFFMLVQEAVHLVLHASALGEGGEIFLLDMGEPVKIIDLARDMIRLSGLEPNVDIEIRITGLRPGEKLYEELITASEVVLATSHPKIMRLNDPNHRDWEREHRGIAELERLAKTHTAQAIRAKLAEIVPEYQPPGTGSVPEPTPVTEQPSGAIAAPMATGSEPRVRRDAHPIVRLQTGAVRNRA